MKTIIKHTLIFGLVLLLAGAGNIKAQNVGDAAPDFSLETLKSKTFTLSQHRGKVVFIFLFGNNCPHCIANAPNTESSIYQVFKDNDSFEAVGIDTWNGSKSSVQSFKNRTNLSYQICLDGSTVQSAYSSTYDRILIVDQEGVLRYKATANATTRVTGEAAAMIESLLAGGSTGIDDSELSKSELVTYPNPVSDILNIRFGSEPGKKVQLNLIDQTGRTVLSEERTVGQSGEINLMVDEYSSGFYFLRTRIEDDAHVSRIVIR